MNIKQVLKENKKELVAYENKEKQKKREEEKYRKSVDKAVKKLEVEATKIKDKIKGYSDLSFKFTKVCNSGKEYYTEPLYLRSKIFVLHSKYNKNKVTFSVKNDVVRVRVILSDGYVWGDRGLFGTYHDWPRNIDHTFHVEISKNIYDKKIIYTVWRDFSLNNSPQYLEHGKSFMDRFTNKADLIKYLNKTFKEHLKLESLKNKIKENDVEAKLKELNELHGGGYTECILEKNVYSFKKGFIMDNLKDFLRLDLIKKATDLEFNFLESLSERDLISLLPKMENYGKFLDLIIKETCEKAYNAIEHNGDLYIRGQK